LKRIEKLNLRAAEGRPSKPVAVKNALLYVSKHISEEACPVLYGGHKFRVGIARALDWFLVLIGENKQHLRHIRVMQDPLIGNLRAVGRITNNLAAIGGLCSLTLRPAVRPDFNTSDRKVRFIGDKDIHGSRAGEITTKLALVFEKLLRTLHQAQKSGDKVAGVIGIFRLDFTPCCESSIE
jgi:hypothetical protein